MFVCYTKTFKFLNCIILKVFGFPVKMFLFLQLTASAERQRKGQQLRIGPVQHRDGQHGQIPGEGGACGSTGPPGSGPEDPGGDAEPHAGRGEPAEADRRRRETHRGAGRRTRPPRVTVYAHNPHPQPQRGGVSAVRDERLQQTPQPGESEGVLLSFVRVQPSFAALRLHASSGSAQTAIPLLVSAEAGRR